MKTFRLTCRPSSDYSFISPPAAFANLDQESKWGAKVLVVILNEILFAPREASLYILRNLANLDFVKGYIFRPGVVQYIVDILSHKNFRAAKTWKVEKGHVTALSAIELLRALGETSELKEPPDPVVLEWRRKTSARLTELGYFVE